MTIRYLYGKKKFLAPVIEGKKGLRLSDLSHYSRMENEKMRDNEMEKIFTLDRRQVNIVIAGRVMNPDEMAADPFFTLTPRHCYCVCFTSRKNDPELYGTFNADICIGFDVEMLQERLEIASERFPGMDIKGQDVTYYHLGTFPGTFTPEELVFCKPSQFSHETEYRIALFYPESKSGFKTSDGTVIPFRIEGESMHMEISHLEKRFISDCVTEVFYP
ncbi:hypothetical protein [Pantoea sp. S18]|uniref:hypothetical protein n=1 Tax=Pantoea sp. S18 TaxID=3019892 RepID=UPI002B1F95CB|nr:hypothetical protein [Pantoea sp. S18]MEA5105650.1 hypothetical protein [Pantoea sp. S18]